MKRRSQTVLGFQNNTQQTVNVALTRLLKTGIIERVSGNQALVRLDGTVAIKPADLYVPAEAGDRCVLSRPSEQHRWMVIGNLKTHQQPRPEFSPSNFGELSPPTSFQAFSTLAGHCGWVWAAPPQKAVAFEVQYNTVADPTGATAGIMTRGSYFFVASATNLFARARSVGPHFQTSAWSNWVECAPGTGGGEGGVTDAANLIYTPAVLADWTGSADPGDTADALDQLAARTTDLETAPGGSATDFTDLGDVPASYTGQANKILSVKATEDGLEFVSLGSSTDGDAIHDNVSGEITALTEKVTPHNDDVLLIEDSEASNAKKKVKISNLPSSGGGITYQAKLYTPATVTGTTSAIEYSTTPDAGSFTIPGNTLAVGDVVRIRCVGTNKNLSGTARAFTWRVFLNGTTIMLSAGVNITSVVGDSSWRTWMLDISLVVTAIGASGHLAGAGFGMTELSNVGQGIALILSPIGATFGDADTTGNVTVTVGLSFSANDATNISSTLHRLDMWIESP